MPYTIYILYIFLFLRLYEAANCQFALRLRNACIEIITKLTINMFLKQSFNVLRYR